MTGIFPSKVVSKWCTFCLATDKKITMESFKSIGTSTLQPTVASSVALTAGVRPRVHPRLHYSVFGALEYPVLLGRTDYTRGLISTCNVEMGIRHPTYLYYIHPTFHVNQETRNQDRCIEIYSISYPLILYYFTIIQTNWSRNCYRPCELLCFALVVFVWFCICTVWAVCLSCFHSSVLRACIWVSGPVRMWSWGAHSL